MKKGKEAVNELYEGGEDREFERTVVVLRIKEAIDKRGMTQKDLAEKTGIRPAAISQLARGFVDRLNLDHVGRIAAALGITDIRELVTLEFEGDAIAEDNEKPSE